MHPVLVRPRRSPSSRPAIEPSRPDLAPGAVARPARAQRRPTAPDARHPRRSSRRARAGDADATAVELNPGAARPAQRRRAWSWSAILVVERRGAARPRRRPAVSARSSGRTAHFGIGLPGRRADARRRASTAAPSSAARRTRCAWGDVRRSASAGRTSSDRPSPARTPSTPACRLAARRAGFALGFVGAGLQRSRPHGLDAAARWTGELAMRPLGTDRLEMAGRRGARRGAALARGRAALSAGGALADGLRPFAEVETPAARRATMRCRARADYRVTARALARLRSPGRRRRGRAGLRTDATGGDAGAAASSCASAAIAIRRRWPTRRHRPRRPGARSTTTASSWRWCGACARWPPTTRRRRPCCSRSRTSISASARIEELRDLFAALRARGKRRSPTRPSRRRASTTWPRACDAIVICTRRARCRVNGIAQNVTFYKDAMDRAGRPRRSGAHRRVQGRDGAVHPERAVGAGARQQEPAARRRVRPAGRRDRGTDAHAARGHAHGRAPRVRALIDRGVFTPIEAQLAGLVDAVSDEGELRRLSRPGARGSPRIAVRDPDSSPMRRRAWPSRRVAVVLVDGTIVDGHSQQLPFGIGVVRRRRTRWSRRWSSAGATRRSAPSSCA